MIDDAVGPGVRSRTRLCMCVYMSEQEITGVKFNVLLRAFCSRVCLLIEISSSAI